MSGANELLDSLSEGDVMTYTANSATEGHIVIGADRFITVPEELKRIAVQHDHNIETVTFDCPRYWDEHDLTEMAIYINYRNANAVLGAFRAENVTVDPDDSNMIHFTWTISGNVTTHKGSIVFLVCAKTVNTDTGEEVLHWNSEINKDTYVSEGLEAVATTYKSDTDLYTQLLQIVDSAEVLDVLGTGVNSERHNGVPKENASGDNSFVQGRGTIARGVNQHARGRFNVADTANKYADIVGNGTSDSNRSNAYTLDWDGNAEYAGGIKAKGVDILNELDKHDNRSVEVVVDDTVAYQKAVPANSLPNAKVTRIGGMTRKCTNLLPYPYDDTTKTVNGITFTDNGDGSITVNGTATADAVFNLSRVLIKATQKYFASGCPLGGSQTTYYLLPRGFGKDTGNGILINGTDSDFSSLSQIVITSGTTVNNLVFKPMLNEGNTALPYELYFEGLRSAPVSAVESEGANLWGFGDNTFDVNKQFRLSKPLPAGQYTVSALISSNDADGNKTSALFMDEAGTGIEYAILNRDIYNSVTITTDRDTYYIRLYAGTVMSNSSGDSSTWKNIMLHRGSTALPYTPYFKRTLEIPEAVQALDGYGWGVSEDVYNYVDLEKKQFAKRVGKIAFTGSEAWEKYGTKQYGMSLSAIGAKPNAGAMCDRFTQGYTGVGKFFVGLSGIAFFADYETVGEWKSYLSEQYANGTPVILYYELATPEITDISDILPASNALKVESGGTVTMVNEYGYAVPSTIHFYTSKDVQEAIGAEEVVGNLVGNASTADKLSGARTITLSGDVEGTAEFDGGTDVTVNTKVKNLTHTHNNATESTAGFMSAVDAKYLVRIRTGDIGNFSGKTLGDLQTALLTWVSTRANYPNATAVFSCETIQNIWNAGDTSATFNAGAQWTVRLETSFGGTNYCQLYFSRYFDKDVYMAALSNGNWQKMRKLAFTDEMTNHRNIFVLDGVPTDLSAYADGDIIMVKES